MVDESENFESPAEPPQEENLKQQAEQLKAEVSKALSRRSIEDLGGEPLDIERALLYLWMTWADFHLTITWPLVNKVNPPILHYPKDLDDGRKENVFTIVDYGSSLHMSRGADVFDPNSGLSKYFNTIDKMIMLLLEKLRGGGIKTDEEVRVAFDGFDLGCRKAFESILNLEENVLVINYDPGEWGDLYMKNILEMVERGYGMPKASPRTDF